MEAQKQILLLNGVPHDAAMLRRLAGSAPLIDVKVEELNPFEGPNANPHHQVEITPTDAQVLHEQPVVFRQDGKYTVLLGRGQVFIEATAEKSKALKVRLISTPTLKKCRIEQQAETAPEQHWRDEPSRSYSEQRHHSVPRLRQVHPQRTTGRDSREQGDDREYTGTHSLSRSSRALLEQEAAKLTQRAATKRLDVPSVSLPESQQPYLPDYERQPRPAQRRYGSSRR